MGHLFPPTQLSHTMTSSYKELLKQREALEQQIGEARKRELSDAVSQVRALVAEFGLTAQDVFPTGRARSASAGTKVAPKYRDPATGQTWTGRGKAPKWIQNENREKFAI
jgi:DNA-binding protein H-NS